jgi:hypothetical protein
MSEVAPGQVARGRSEVVGLDVPDGQAVASVDGDGVAVWAQRRPGVAADDGPTGFDRVAEPAAGGDVVDREVPVGRPDEKESSVGAELEEVDEAACPRESPDRLQRLQVVLRDVARGTGADQRPVRADDGDRQTLQTPEQRAGPAVVDVGDPVVVLGLT